jgi:hypothetical protein
MKRKLLAELRAALDGNAPVVANLLGLPQRPFTLEWMTDGGSGAAHCHAAEERICLDYGWFSMHRDDVGALSHEYTHLLQNVPGGTCPGEVIEGIADAVRYVLGQFDPTWWTPSPVASRIAGLPADRRKELANLMRAGRYREFDWHPSA